MKWEVQYVVEGKDGKKKKKKDTVEARSVREASMMAHSVIVRPLQSQKVKVTITSLKALEPA